MHLTLYFRLKKNFWLFFLVIYYRFGEDLMILHHQH